MECLLSKPMFIFIQVGVPCKWVNDSQRLILEWFDAICNSPSQVYHLALAFCPSSSWLGKCYATELSHQVKVVKGIPARWGSCSRMVTLDSTAWALTSWKDTVVVGLESGDIVVFDGITGTQTAILSEHTDLVESLAFLPDGTSLVSGSQDNTIKLWDLQTGGVIKTFHGHTNWVTSVSVSADCSIIASGSWDKTIRLWDIHTEECHCIIKQQDQVCYVKFSPTDPQHLISVSGGEVQHWDMNGHQTKTTHNTSSIGFSSDGAHLALCKREGIVIQNTSSGSIVARFPVDNAATCGFSPDDRLIAVATGRTAYVWDITSSHPNPIMTVEEQTFLISLTFFSPSSLISSSDDKSIKFWQIGALQTDPVMTDLESTPLLLPQIRSITLQVDDGIAISTDSTGVVRTWDISTGLCKGCFQTPAEHTDWRDVRLTNGRLIFVWYANRKICIWDVEKGEFIQMVDVVLDYGDNDGVQGVRISGDGTNVFCLHWLSIKAWSIQTGEALGEVGLEYCKFQRSLTVDGLRVWVHSPESEPLGWDFGIPCSPPVQLSNTSSLHPNNSELWDIKQSKILDSVTGKVVFQLAGRFAEPVDLKWDSRCLVAGYKSGEVVILDFNHMFL